MTVHPLRALRRALPLALTVLAAGCGSSGGDEGDTTTPTDTTGDSTDASGDAVLDGADGDATAVTCPAGVTPSVTGTWAIEETESTLAQVAPFGTMTQVATILYLVTPGHDASGDTLSATLCQFTVEDDAHLFTTRMSDATMASLDPFVRTFHVGTDASGAATLTVDDGYALRGVHLTDVATEAMPTDASDARVYDQDQDSHPGITLVITGALQGGLYVAQRHHAALAGCFDTATKAHGLTAWTSEQVIYGSTPDTLSANKPVTETDPDPTKSHFVFAKVGDGDDCAALIGERASVFGD